MSKDLISVVVIILVLVVGGLAYLLMPGRVSGPASGEISTSTMASSTLITATTTNANPQNLPTYDNGQEQTGS